MEQQIVIVIRDGVLSLGATEGMKLAEINLFLDMAKQQILATGQVDHVIEAPGPELALEDVSRNGGT